MIDLLPQQKEAKTKLLPYKVGALFMAAGAAKTRVAVELVNDVPDVDLVVWVGPYRTIFPKPGIRSIKDEIGKWGGFQCSNIVYMGIETIQASDRQYLQLYNRIAATEKPFIIVDESITIKNIAAKRTQRLLELGKMAEHKVILNGTPVTRNLLDLWSQMEFLSPKIMRMRMAEFKNTFCKYTRVTKSFGGHKKYTKEFITGYENIDYLYSLIRHYVYECDLKLNIKQLYNEYQYQVDQESKEKYTRLKEKYLDNEVLMWKNNNIFLEMTQKMQHAYCVTESKFKVLDKHFEEYPEDKHIIFCKYVVSREECAARYPKSLVLSYQSDSRGLNLQERPYTVYFDKIWDWGLRHQSGRRNYRTGNEYDCRYWDLTGNVGLESLIDKNIEKKTSQIDYFRKVSKKELDAAL